MPHILDKDYISYKTKGALIDIEISLSLSLSLSLKRVSLDFL